MIAEYPLVSVIMATYNRAGTIERAIKSVLNQSYMNFELIIVDDGSTDNSSEILKSFSDSRIRIFKHEKNRGVCAAKNTGLKAIKGEWFTTFDSDDEMLPEALKTMMNIPLNFDRSVTAVTCNCLDTSEKDFKGKGITNDQYLDVETLMTKCKGDFWGLTKTSLLMNDCFNENISGYETVLWYKIDDRAKRYYIHKQLLIVYTEGQDRVSNSKFNFNKELRLYTSLINEEYYLDKIKKYTPDEFINICRTGLIVTRVNRQMDIAKKYFIFLNSLKKSLLNSIIYKSWTVAILMKNLMVFKLYIKLRIKALIK